MNKYFSEFIGTFVLIFIGCGAIMTNEISGDIGHVGISLAFGIAVLIMIYSVGNVSGAHFNPAVTIAFYFVNKLDKKMVLPYICSQLSGALTASLLLKFIYNVEGNLFGTNTSVGIGRTFLLEVIFTFILMVVILNVSTGYKEKGIMAGVAVGFTVFICALVCGPLTGASLNPARSIAPALVSLELTNVWVYIVAPIVGAVLATKTCSWTQGEKCCKTE